MTENSKTREHWQVKKLGEVCKIVYGKGLPTKQLKKTGFPVFGANGIIGFNDKFLYKESEVLISCRGAYSGKVNFSPPNCFITNNSLILEINDEKALNKKYLFYILQSVNKTKLVSGTAQPQVTINNAIELSFPLPSIDEQSTIVSKIEELLSDLENGKQQLLTAQQQLKTYRQSLLKWAFEGRLTNENVKEGELPEGWKWVKIEDSAFSFDSRRKPINKSERLKRSGSIPYYGANGRVGWIDDYIFDEPLICVVEDETFTGREIPFSYKIAGKTWVNNHAHVLKPKEITNIDFLNYQLYYYPFLPITTGTTGRKKLTKSALMNAPIKICSLNEQQLVVNELESKLTVCDKIEETISQGLQQAETLKQSILKMAFEGRLV